MARIETKTVIHSHAIHVSVHNMTSSSLSAAKASPRVERRGRRKGLTDAEVERSRKLHGSNVLTPPPRTPLWRQFLAKFDDSLIKILLVALMLSVGIACYEYFVLHQGTEALFEPVGIFAAIMLATLVGFLVEVNANKKFDLLNKSNDDIGVKVVRNGHVTIVPRRDVVVGDVVLLDTGDRVPADGTLLNSTELRVNESALTGEPEARKTHVASASNPDATYAVQQVLRGSTVVEGNGVMEVERVGDATEYGQVYKGAQIEYDQRTPLMVQFDSLGRLISRASYVIAALIIVGRLLVLWFDGKDDGFSLDTANYLLHTVMLAVTLVVVSVPEGLPMSVTLSLALSMRRMLHQGNLVRKMHACETMGAATIICTDKTGTLTHNQMRVASHHFYVLDDTSLDAEFAQRIVDASIACNTTAHIDDSKPDYPVPLGNPTEGALLLWQREHTATDYIELREQATIVAQMPFSTERKYMVTIVDDVVPNHRVLLAKGAGEIIARHCDKVADGSPFSAVADELESYQHKSMRTLAFAYKLLPITDSTPDIVQELALCDMTLMGIVGIADPVREDVPAAIADCHCAGIEVKIVTGDTPGTAREIGRQVGIWSDGDDEQGIITGAEFAALSDDEAASRARAIKIMSRARPDDKARLVRLLQQQGEVVAVTGDGTNDAPALNAAQIGLSMGDGTSVAKEASDITIMNNSFSTIGKAVLWGRSLYRNIQRFIMFQLTVNVCACLVVAVGAFFSMQSPLDVTQMLWVNLIMDTFAALALASLPPNSVVMRTPPRRMGENIITSRMGWFIMGFGLIFGIAMIVLFGMYHGWTPRGRIDPHEMSLFFTTFVLLQFWNLFNARSFATGHHSAFHNMKRSKVFFAVLVVILVGQYLIVTYAGKMFGCAPLSWCEWGMLLLATSPVMWFGEFYHDIKFRALKRAKG